MGWGGDFDTHEGDMRSVAEIFQSYAVLDAEGRHINGTDKESNHHYGDAYEKFFTAGLFDPIGGETIEVGGRYYSSTRGNVELMMEIGVADGSSLLAWREVFPNALCVGLDIHPAVRLEEPCMEPQRPVEFYLGDQRSLEDCRRAAAGRQFDFICEDATHLLEDSLRTLLYLWPYVRPGGLYVIEEFAGVGSLRHNIVELWPNAEVVDTHGPFGGVEPLVVLRKPK